MNPEQKKYINNTRSIYDKKCYEAQQQRDYNMNDYLLNKPVNNCKGQCLPSNPEIRVPTFDKLKNTIVEDDLLGITNKEQCNLNRHSCDKNNCKTQIFEELANTNYTDCDLNTVNSRLDNNNHLSEVTSYRWNSLCYNPQDHINKNDSHLAYVSSRISVKDNYVQPTQSNPIDSTNQLEHKPLKGNTYVVGDIPQSNSEGSLMV